MAKKKFTKKQLAAQKLFAKRARAGTLKKGSKKSKKSKSKLPKSEINRLRRARSKGVSNADRNQLDSLLLAIEDPKVKEIIIRK